MTEGTVDTTGMDRAELLMALFNAASAGGSTAGIIAGLLPEPMDIAEATALLSDGRTYFDYHRGRVMKIDVMEDHLKPRLYDRDNGEGAVARVVAQFSEGGG